MVDENYSLEKLPNNILRGIYQYWLDMKGTRSMPSRADLNPVDIVRLLPNISLVNVENNPRRYKMRLVGTESVKAMGFDTTGKYLDEYPGVERILKQKYDDLVNSKMPYFTSDKLKWIDKTVLNIKVIGLPLSSDGQNVDILMFGVYYQFPTEVRTDYSFLGTRH